MTEIFGDKRDYYAACSRKKMFMVLCVAVTVIAFFMAITVGFYHIDFLECFRIIGQHITGNITDPRADDILINSRIPICIFAIIAGAALSMGGAVMQTMLRNPLADPYSMGISSGASLGATIAITIGATAAAGTFFASNLSTVVFAFLFSLIPVAIIMIFTSKGNATPTKILLIGIAVMYMFSAVVSMLMTVVSEDTLSEIYSWQIGTLALIEWSDIAIPLIMTVLCGILLFSQYRKLNVLMSGSRISKSLGVNPHIYIRRMMVVVSLMTAAVVSFSGTIGFIGLVGPHIARVFVGSDSKYLIPASAGFGAMFLLIANSIASIAGSYGLPVGVISAIIGCPLFVYILVRMRKKVWN